MHLPALERLDEDQVLLCLGEIVLLGSHLPIVLDHRSLPTQVSRVEAPMELGFPGLGACLALGVPR